MCNVTGNKPSDLQHNIIPFDGTEIIPVEMRDGRVVQMRANQIVGGGGGGGNFVGAFFFTAANFSGTNLAVPGGVNGGKLPTNVALVVVKTEGIEDYPVLDYNITYGVGPAVDTIVFTNARVSANILVKFQIFS